MLGCLEFDPVSRKQRPPSTQMFTTAKEGVKNWFSEVWKFDFSPGQRGGENLILEGTFGGEKLNFEGGENFILGAGEILSDNLKT